MAELGDPSPVVDEGDVQQPSALDPTKLMNEWSDWMSEPGNRQAIMQFGINLMQPMGYGQTAAGHFGRAIGGAGEAVDRYQTAQLKEEEMQRKNIDTDSRLREREGKLNLGEQGLAIKRQAEDTRRMRAETEERNIASRIQLNDRKIADLEAQAARYGATQDIKDRLEIAKADKANAEAALAGARTTATGTDSETRRMKAEHEIAVARQNHDIELAKLKERADRTKVIDEVSLRRLYTSEQANEGKRELFTPNYRRPDESYEQWKSRKGFTSPVSGPQSAPAPAPTGPQTGPQTTAPPVAAGTPVGQEKTYNQGTFVKVKPGPDSDQSTWKKKGE